jgi:GTP cyclohydrolase II
MISFERPPVQRVASATLPTAYGEYTMHVYSDADGREHVALTVGEVTDGRPVPTRLHSECLTGDVFASLRCDCGEQLDWTLAHLQEVGRGALLYLRQEGRGIGLANKIRAYALQEQGFDTVDANLALGLPADGRDYRLAAEMLRDLGIGSVVLLTNNPQKIRGLERHGILVLERLPAPATPNCHNQFYLETKRRRMGHLE